MNMFDEIRSTYRASIPTSSQLASIETNCQTFVQFINEMEWLPVTSLIHESQSFPDDIKHLMTYHFSLFSSTQLLS